MNGKMYINIVITARTIGLFEIVLDNGAGSRFIRLVEVPHRLRKKIELLGSDVTARNARLKQVSLLSSIVITVKLERLCKGSLICSQ